MVIWHNMNFWRLQLDTSKFNWLSLALTVTSRVQELNQMPELWVQLPVHPKQPRGRRGETFYQKFPAEHHPGRHAKASGFRSQHTLLHFTPEVKLWQAGFLLSSTSLFSSYMCETQNGHADLKTTHYLWPDARNITRPRFQLSNNPSVMHEWCMKKNKYYVEIVNSAQKDYIFRLKAHEQHHKVVILDFRAYQWENMAVSMDAVSVNLFKLKTFLFYL